MCAYVERYTLFRVIVESNIFRNTNKIMELYLWLKNSLLKKEFTSDIY